MWASKREGLLVRSKASEYAEMGVPLQPGNNDRTAGKAKVHERLAWGEGSPPRLQVFRPAPDGKGGCPHLVREMPALVPDPHKPEDVDTLGSDHAYDALRYGLVALASQTVAQPATSYGFGDRRR
jgi:hypothetical protein